MDSTSKTAVSLSIKDFPDLQPGWVYLRGATRIVRNDGLGMCCKNVPVSIDTNTSFKQNSLQGGLYIAYQIKLLNRQSVELLVGFEEALE
jgi:hypothetical protein